MSVHALDHPTWHALTSVHASFAEGSGLAKRYPLDVAPLAAVREQSRAAYDALGELFEPDESAILFLDTPPAAPDGWHVDLNVPMEQMVCGTPPAAGRHRPEIAALGAGDVAQMQALAKLAAPGPFRTRTIEFGGYVGIHDAGQLVAMSGRRLALTGFTEVSAVCTHPDYRGRGYGEALVTAVVRGLFAEGVTPFLGVRQSNAGAIRLYERLGFTVRRTLHLAAVRRPL